MFDRDFQATEAYSSHVPNTVMKSNEVLTDEENHNLVDIIRLTYLLHEKIYDKHAHGSIVWR